MNNISYSELFDKEFEKVFQKHENEIEKILKSNKKQGRRFGSFYNTILSELETQEYRTYYIATSKLFDNLIDLYKRRNSIYEKGFEHLIFENELLSLFNKIEKIKKEYNFIEFIKELATVEAISDVYSRFRHNSKIYEMMYNLNRLESFVLLRPTENIEKTPFFNVQLYETRNLENPDRYKDFNDFKEKEAIASNFINNTLSFIEPPRNSDNNVKKNITGNFDIYNHRIKFDLNSRQLYDSLCLNHIDSKKTSHEDFKNVLVKDWDKHSSKIHFKSKTQATAFLLRNLEFLFGNLNFTQIGKSRLFYSNIGNPFTRSGLQKGLDPLLKDNNSNKNHEKIKREVKLVLFLLNQFSN